MEQRLERLALVWNFLRVLLTGVIAATSMLILISIPVRWWIPAVPVFALAIIAVLLTVTGWKTVWIWIAMLAQVFLFALGLFGVIFGFTSEGYVPVLLLAFTLILAGEHAMTTALSYSAQFSNRGELAIREFNSTALRISLNHLYERLARDGLVLGGGFVLSVVAAGLGAFSSASSILSDPSLYIVIASTSLAALLTLKED